MTENVSGRTASAGLFKGSMLYCGAHYTLCPVEIREIWAQGFAFPDGPQTLKNIVCETMGDPNLEMVVVSTCNRFDICLFGQLNQSKLTDVFVQFAQWTLAKNPKINTTIQKHTSWTKDVPAWLRFFVDEKALHHLFRVGSSLDSLVVGEPHILGQLKDAFQNSVTTGFAHQEATLTFNRAFQVAKKVRTETDLGKNGISIGHAAVDIVRRVFENLNAHSCLVLGAGEMAKITAQHLHSCGAGRITVANRSIANAQRLAEQFPNGHALLLDQGLTRIGEFDIVIAATSAQEFLVKQDIHSALLSKRKVGTPCVIVDISVPRNVDPALGKLKNIFVFDVDDLDKIMESSRKAREKSAIDAESIIQSELAEFISHRRQRESLSHIGQFHALVKDVVQKEILKSLKSSQGMSEEQIRITSDAVAKKLVAHPALLARTDARMEADTDRNSVGEIIRFLFNLDHNEREKF